MKFVYFQIKSCYQFKAFYYILDILFLLFTYAFL